MAYQGLRGFQDFATDEAPQHWVDGIRQIQPWGHVQLIALSSLMPRKKVTSVYDHWWTESVQSKVVDIASGAIYVDQALSSAYSASGVAGQVLYVKMAAADQQKFAVNDQAMFRSNTYWELDTQGVVVASVSNGASSYVAVKLLEADDNGSGISKDLSDICADGVLMESGGVSYDGAPIGTAVSFPPTKWDNNQHTVRTPLELTRRAILEETRTMPAYDHVFAQSNLYHHLKMEKIALWSILTESTSTPNGKAQTTMDGMVTAMRTYETANSQGNIKAWNRDSDFAGQEWEEGGYKWLEKYEEVCMREGQSIDRIEYCGSYAFSAFSALAIELGFVEIEPMSSVFGQRVRTFRGSLLNLHLAVHPLFNNDTLWKRAALGFIPDNLTYTYLTDTMLKSDKGAWEQGGQIAVDGIKEEWLTDFSLRYYFPQCNHLWFGLGLANTAT